MGHIDWPKPILKSKITDLIDRILMAWCDENGHRGGSLEATNKATSLLQWIEFGVTDEGELAHLIRNDIVINPT